MCLITSLAFDSFAGKLKLTIISYHQAMKNKAGKKGGKRQSTLDKFVGNSSSSEAASSDSEFNLSEEEKSKPADWWTRCKSRD